jgi:hypothetical protein
MLRQILIDTRDHAYHLAKKQSGPERAKGEYKFKMIGALCFYYIGILMLLAHFLSHFFSLQAGKNLSLSERFIIGIVIFLIPMWFLINAVIKSLENVPIPEEITAHQYKKKRVVALSVIITGILFFLACAVLPVYFGGGKIHLGSYVIQKK